MVCIYTTFISASPNTVIPARQQYNEFTTINHRGAINARSALNWLYDNIEDPDYILVTGCSAGSYASIFWSLHIADHYPDTNLFQFGDAGAGIITDDFMSESFANWNTEDTIATWIFPNNTLPDLTTLRLSDIYQQAGVTFPNARFSQFSHYYDWNQVFFWRVMQEDDDNRVLMPSVQDRIDWNALMIEEVDNVTAPNYFTLIGPGDGMEIRVGDNGGL